MWDKQAVLWNTGSKNTSMLSPVGMLTSQQLQNTWQRLATPSSGRKHGSLMWSRNSINDASWSLGISTVNRMPSTGNRDNYHKCTISCLGKDNNNCIFVLDLLYCSLLCTCVLYCVCHLPLKKTAGGQSKHLAYNIIFWLVLQL